MAEKGKHKFPGLVETGLSENALQQILQSAKAGEKSIFPQEPKVNFNSPFRKKIKKAEIIWLEPNINCKVKYLELDQFGMMQHASFRGMSAKV